MYNTKAFVDKPAAFVVEFMKKVPGIIKKYAYSQVVFICSVLFLFRKYPCESRDAGVFFPEPSEGR